MHVSAHYNLGRSQGLLEFVDVDVTRDVPLFIDPGAIRLLPTNMARQCASLVQSFFGTVLDDVRSGRGDRAQELLSTLNELNETRLGYTQSGSQGSGVGVGLATELHDALVRSRAVQSGVLQDLEETALFVRGVDRDRISDIVTNIIFGPIVSFTQEMCRKYGIPMEPGIAYYRWDRRAGWVPDQGDLPIAANRPLVLVPRAFVRRRRNVLDASGYYQHYILPYLQQQHLDANSGLVTLLRDGRMRPPTKRVLRGLHPDVKATNTRFTEADPELLQRYRDDQARDFQPISHDDLAGGAGVAPPDFDALLADVVTCAPGDADAARYESAIEKLLTALLYPALDNPVTQHRIHGGRKRIDIDYENQAGHGFFHWFHAVHGGNASYIPVECKNYSRDPANPELDQLLGRFTSQRGNLGMLCYRSSADKRLIQQRCKDAALAGQGYILALDDDDLTQLVCERKSLLSGEDFRFVHDRFRDLTSG